jgi:predicted double-glycine peptidase
MRRSIAAVLAGSALAALSAVCGPVQAGNVRVNPDQVGNVHVNADQAGVTAALTVHSWKDIPFRWVVRQQYDFSCGSAALATLLLFHYGVKVNEQDVFQAMWKAGAQAKIRKVGFSLLDMKRTLHDHGLQADGYRLTLDQVERAKIPAIALITVGRYKHFVVIKGVRDGRVLTGDPALGLKIYPRKDFEGIWNGIVFLIHDHPGDPPVFNRAGEWRPWAYAPADSAVDRASLAAFTSELPVLHQITPVTPTPNL